MRTKENMHNLRSGGVNAIDVPGLDMNKQDAEIFANKSGRRLPTIADFISNMGRDSSFFEKAKGHWYWVENSFPIKVPGYCKIDYSAARLESVTRREWDLLPESQRAYSWTGNPPLVIGIGIGSSGGIIVVGPYAGSENIARAALIADVQLRK